MKVYLAVENMNEGYDATVTLEMKVFATEELAKSWVNEIKSDSYLWRDYESVEVIQSLN